jgi:hypothetical protein
MNENDMVEIRMEVWQVQRLIGQLQGATKTMGRTDYEIRLILEKALSDHSQAQKR